MLKNKKTFFLALLAILALFCFTPLGALPALGPIVATLATIPVIIAAQLLGTKAGAVMGFFGGLFSLIVWTFMPPNPAVAFVFTPFYTQAEISGNFASILISFMPRIFTGVAVGLSYGRLSKAFASNQILCFSISAIVGSLANTLGVMGGIWLFFGEQYASVFENAMPLIMLSTILINGIPEAIVAAVASLVVCLPLYEIKRKQESFMDASRHFSPR